MSLIVYGAHGYTGDLIVREAIARGVKPVLSARNADRLRDYARDLGASAPGATGLELRPCSLDDEQKLADLLADIDVVIHAAGPFTQTSKPMGRACLSAGTHYLDITGEIPVFEKLAAIDDRAKERGIMMMPGTGFDVVPSDCLAAHLKRRLPTGNRLTLAIGSTNGGLSRGTIKTMLRGSGMGGFERINGKIVPSPIGKVQREIDFGRGPVTAISIPWGDLSTAFHSTGIENITTLAAYPPAMRAVATRLHWIGPVLRTIPIQAVLHAGVDAFLPPGPSEETRRTAISHVWGELTDEDGNRACSRISGPEGYAMTAITSVDIAMRTLKGEGRPGFQTPSMLLGPDYVLGLDGFEREDLP